MIAVVSINTGTEVITATTSGLSTGHALGIRNDKRTVSLPATNPQVTARGVYFANIISANSLSLHTTPADSLGDDGRIDFTGDPALPVGANVFLERLSVRERIERRLRAILAGVPGVGDCQRVSFDALDLASGDISLSPLAASVVRETHGGVGRIVEWEGVISAGLRYVNPETDPRTAGQVISDYLAVMHSTLFASDLLIEDYGGGQTVLLAEDVKPTAEPAVFLGTNGAEIGILLELSLVYRTARNDPFTPL